MVSNDPIETKRYGQGGVFAAPPSLLGLNIRHASERTRGESDPREAQLFSDQTRDLSERNCVAEITKPFGLQVGYWFQ